MPEVPTFDAEFEVRAWARAHPRLVPLIAGRTFFGLPREPVYPLIVLGRVGGGLDPSDAPIDRPRISFACWGPAGNTSRADASTVAYTLRAIALGLVHGTPVGAVFASGAATLELGPLWLPDRKTGRARYVLDLAFHLYAGGG